DDAAILPDALALKVINALPAADALEDARLLLPAIGGEEAPDRLPDHFGGRVAKDALGAGVPGGHDTVEVLADDRVVRRIDDGGQPLRESRGPALHGEVARHLDRADDMAEAVANRRDRDRDRKARAVLAHAFGLEILD